MSEREMAHSAPRAASSESRGPFLTLLESWALALAVITLLLLYQAAAATIRTSRPSTGDVWMFVPHVVLIALIVGGLRRLAAVTQGLILAAAALVGVVACIDAIGGGHDMEGLGFAAVLQLPLFILCLKSAKDAAPLDELARMGPRIALGALAGTIGWFAAGAALTHATAPFRAAEARVAAARHREAMQRDAEALASTLAACLQRVPVTADSQPLFPAALSELPDAACPEARRAAPDGFVVEYVPGPADSAGRHREFRLSVHERIAGDTARSYETDESMILRRWYGRGTGHFPAYPSNIPPTQLAEIGRCIESARSPADEDGYTSYPGSLAEVEQRHPCGLRVTTDSTIAWVPVALGKAQVRYTPPPGPRPDDAPGGYALLLEPARDSLGRSTGAGLLSYFSDTAGMLHVTRRGRAATEADPALPDCAVHGSGPRSPLLPCRDYLPRQRWGLTSQLPTIGWSMSGTGTLGAGDTLALIPQYQPVTPADSAVEAHIQWEANGRDSTIARRPGVPFGEAMGTGVDFRLRHAYADTGLKRIHFRVRTAAGEEYEMRDSVRVLLPRRYR